MSADTANAILSTIAEKLIMSLVDATSRQYKTNIQNLEEQVVRLQNLRTDNERFFEEQRRNNVEKAQSSAGWLNNVEKVTVAAKEALEAKDELGWWCVNLKNRYGLSRKSTKLFVVIRELQDQAPIKVAIHNAPPAAMLRGAGSNDASKDFESRRKIMDDVMKALEDDNINIIGICGLGGIGKTTILNEVRERARAQKLFVEVAMTTLSQVTSVFEIQKNLAVMLGLTKIQGVSDIIGRADLLHTRLTDGSTILVVLDDIWSEIKLQDIGIPVGNGHARCKVVLASRYENVCAKMGAQTTIPVDVLSKEEAWHMFKKAAGDCIERQKLEKIAKEVANECGGLPIALLTLARALSNKKKRVWGDALRQLRQSCVIRIPEMKKEVYSSIMLSYNYLASEQPEAQPLLLICCQHREDHEIEVERLARYCLALKLFKNVDKLVDARNTTYTLIDHLMSCFLLQAVNVDDEGMYEKVKMHDIVRDVCLSIVSDVKEERDRVYMYIMSQDRSGGLDASIEVDYPKLKVLLKNTLDESSLQDKNCLPTMEELRVFEIYQHEENRDIKPSLQVLENLRMLFIGGESLSEDIMSEIGSLSRLEILSLWFFEIPSFPRQIGQLSNLKLLDLRSFRNEGGLIPSGILPLLNKLEVLWMGSFLLLGTGVDKDIENRESQGHIKELESMPDLTSLQINLVDPNNDLLDLQCFCFENLESFFFASKGNKFYRELNLLIGKRIQFINMVGMKWVLEAKIQFIVRSTLSLRLEDVNDWSDPLMLKEFVSLNELELTRCNQLEYIIPEGSLEKVRILKLVKMANMKRLWMGGSIDPLCLVNLREIEIERCEGIETIFPHPVAKSLGQLQILKISVCGKLEGIFSKGESGTTSSSTAEIKKDFITLFPKLRILYLKRLPKLKGFYNILNIDDGKVLQSFINLQVIMLPSLEKLSCIGLDHIKQIVGGGAFDFDLSLETLFDFEGLHFTGENDQVLTLGGLKDIYLLDLPKLEHLFWQIPQGRLHSFQNLEKLEVNMCKRLGYLISSSMAHVLVNLKSLIVIECVSMKEVIKVDEEYGVEKILLRYLTSVMLKDLKNLSSFCSDDRQSIEFPSLDDVAIYKCPQMKTFCCGHLVAEKVQGVNIRGSFFADNKLIWKGDLNETVRHLTKSKITKGADPVRGAADKYANECSTSEGTQMKASIPLSIATSPNASLTATVVSDSNELIAISSSPDLRKAALPPPIEFIPSASTEQSVHSSNESLVQPKADKELFNKSSSSWDDSGSSISIPLERGTPKKSLMPLSVVSSSNVVLTPDVASPSHTVSENKEELANSSTSGMIKVALSRHIEIVPSSSTEQSVHSSTNSPVQPKAHKEFSDMSLSSWDENWKRSRTLIQGVYVKSEWKTTFEEILTAKPNFLSGFRLKIARVKTDVMESAICSLQILRHRTALTISSDELAYIKDSLDDLETSGLDMSWLERGYQRAIIVIKEQEAISAAAKLAMLEREKMEDEAKLEASTARLDAFKAEYGALMQELEAGKELSGGGFDLESCLGDGLLD